MIKFKVVASIQITHNMLFERQMNEDVIYYESGDVLDCVLDSVSDSQNFVGGFGYYDVYFKNKPVYPVNINSLSSPSDSFWTFSREDFVRLFISLEEAREIKINSIL